MLILVVCALFVANSATAAVRGRRQELGVLAALGWTRPRLFAVVLGEVALIGLIAGILGALLAVPLAAALSLHASPARAALAIPVAIALAVVAGAVPAWLAARADPVASVRPPVLAIRRARQPSGLTGLAIVNVLRTPGRSLIGALSLAVGVMRTHPARRRSPWPSAGAIVGTLLGNVVTVQVRGVDYVAVVTTVILGVLAVADALLISIAERAPEIATIRAFGWPEPTLRRLVITEARPDWDGRLGHRCRARPDRRRHIHRAARPTAVRGRGPGGHVRGAGDLPGRATPRPPARPLPAAQLLAQE